MNVWPIRYTESYDSKAMHTIFFKDFVNNINYEEYYRLCGNSSSSTLSIKPLGPRFKLIALREIEIRFEKCHGTIYTILLNSNPKSKCICDRNLRATHYEYLVLAFAVVAVICFVFVANILMSTFIKTPFRAMCIVLLERGERELKLV